MPRSSPVVTSSLNARAERLVADGTGDVFLSGRHKNLTSVPFASFDPSFLAEIIEPATAEVMIQTRDLFSYGPTEGTPHLRARVADCARVGPDDVVVTDGASQGLLLLLGVLVDTGDRVLTPTPALPAYDRVVKFVGGRPQHYTWHDARERTVAEIEVGIDTAPRTLILNSPHNPTGACLDVADLTRLVRRARERGVFVILDDAYAWMDGDPDRLSHFTAASDGAAGGLAAMCSFGKYFCRPGLRLGCVLSRDKAVLAAAVELKRHLSQCSCPAHETYVTKLFGSGELATSKAALLSRLAERRSKFSDVVASLGGSSRTARTGFYLFADNMERGDAAGLGGIAGSVFGGAPSARRYCLAVSHAAWENFERAHAC